MVNTYMDMPPKGGFSFDLCRRNAALLGAGSAPPKARKTGTTIVGVIYKDGVVLGADTRATGGDVVADKNCEKIHYLAPNIRCCGAGTAADTEAVTAMISSQLDLHRYATGRQSRVITALTQLKSHLFGYQGQVSAALVLGGYDVTGPHLHTVYPHGSTDSLPYATMGSGSLAAMSVFESSYKEDMTVGDAATVCRASALPPPFLKLVPSPAPFCQLAEGGGHGDGSQCHQGGDLQRPRQWEQRGPLRHQQGRHGVSAQLRDAQPPDLRAPEGLLLRQGTHKDSRNPCGGPPASCRGGRRGRHGGGIRSIAVPCARG